MTRTKMSYSALLLAASLVLLPAGCRRSSEPAPTVTAVDEARPVDPAQPAPEAGNVPNGDNTVRDVTEDAVREDACAAETASPVATKQPQDAFPVLTQRVTDFTGVLTQQCVADLNERLNTLEQQTGAQMAVLLVPSLGDNDIHDYANRVFHQSKLGRKGVDDGLLVVASLADRRARVEVGYGLEATLTDAITGDLLRQDLKENFAAQRYNAGISALVDDLSVRIHSGDTAPVKPKEHGLHGLWFFLAMLTLSIVLGGIAESMKVRWPLRLVLIPVAVDVVVLLATVLKLTLGYRLLIAMVPISLAASLLGIPFVRSTWRTLQWLGTCLITSLIIASIAAAMNRSNGHGFHVPDGWGFAAGAIGTMAGSFLFLLTQILPGARRSRGSNRDWDDSPSSSSSSSSDDSSSSDSSGGSSSDSDSGSMSGGGGDSGGGGADTSW